MLLDLQTSQTITGWAIRLAGVAISCPDARRRALSLVGEMLDYRPAPGLLSLNQNQEDHPANV